MAITSISRLQHRRGLLADLPANLNEAELGWCLDTRQLFIGNGNTYTGNSQILTQWSPNDQIITHIYQGYTGVAANTTVSGSPTVRTLSSILNDYLDVKDYGADGNGVTDDTKAIQDAIQDEWARIANSPYSPLMSRNQIFFPAGNYLVSSTILLYPYITLVGEGIDRTQITLVSGSTGPVFRTADSLGQTGANIGDNSATLPTSIVVRDMTVNGSGDASNTNPVIILQRCTDVSIADTKLINSWVPGTGLGNGNNGITIQSLGTAVTTGNINISATTIEYASNAIEMIDPIIKVNIINNTVYGSYNGVYIGISAYGSPNYISVQSTTMQNIDHNGMYIDTAGTVSSIGNRYINVGSGATSAIIFSVNANGCQSVADTFNTGNRALCVVNNNPGKNLIFDPTQTELVSNTPTPFIAAVSSNQVNASTGISFSVAGITTFTAFIDYAVNLGTYRKAGRLSIISDGTTANLVDSSVDLFTGNSITFTVGVTSSILHLYYTTVGTGSGTLSYIQTYWSE